MTALAGVKLPLLGVLAFMIVSTECLAADFSAADLFRQLDPQYISVEDPLPLLDKERIVSSKFVRDDSVCNGYEAGWEPRWYVRENSKTTLTVRTCAMSEVVLRVYRKLGNGFVGVVVSIMGNHGQSQNFRFFDVSSDGKVKREMTAEELGITEVRDNDFLARAQYFDQRDNFPVPLSFHPDDGTIEAEPWTFNSPRWDSKDFVRTIKFIWDGKRFRKSVIDIK
jgi:hypothetical protein